LVRYGFDDVGLGRIIAQTMTVNTASRAVMERVGLTYVRTFPTSTTAPVEIREGRMSTPVQVLDHRVDQRCRHQRSAGVVEMDPLCAAGRVRAQPVEVDGHSWRRREPGVRCDPPPR
jgi:hypothetical protein